MQNSCPLCRRISETEIWESEVPTDPIEITNQIENLDRALEDIRDGRTSMIYYAENREQMCPMCQFLTEGIETEEDRKEFEERLNRKIEELEELRNKQLSGEL